MTECMIYAAAIDKVGCSALSFDEMNQSKLFALREHLASRREWQAGPCQFLPPSRQCLELGDSVLPATAHWHIYLLQTGSEYKFDA
jgi:hypothetical protein